MKLRHTATGVPRARFILGSAAVIVAVICGVVWTKTEPVTPVTFTMGTIPADHILLPDSAPQAVVVLVSDDTGWSDKDQALADQLREQRAAIVGVDLPSYLANLRNKVEECHYLISDIESLSHQIQRAGGGVSYAAPILAGTGAGGGLVLDLVTQTPASTIGSTVVSNPSVAVKLDHPLCTSATHTDNANGEVYTLPVGTLADPVTILLSPAATAESRARVEAFAANESTVVLSEDPSSATELLASHLTAEVKKLVTASAALPVQILPTTPLHDTMAIILSGDGGWRDLDQTIGGIFQSKGIPTIGVDSLHYFWGKRTPEETAADISALIATYSDRWKTPNVLLMGYSFGADVLPATYQALDPATKAHVKQISLLGLSPKADWEVTVSGWLAGPSFAATPTAPPLGQISPGLIQCVYGVAETDSPCPGLSVSGAETIQTQGGHHFDGNYSAIAEKIIAGLDRRRNTGNGK